MRVNYRKLEHDGFVVHHDEEAGVLEIHFSRGSYSESHPIVAMGRAMQEDYDLNESEAEDFQIKVWDLLEEIVIMKAIKRG